MIAEAQPDEATLRQILSNSTVMEGFEDPAVMAAVAEIAQDPAASSQYAGDAKVRSFYKGMEAIMGPRLQQAAARAGEATSRKSKSSQMAGTAILEI
ncbi:hypothetical protein CVIRNUC_010497 [Coccomyxa viridis]|uniref:Uncharacterized protein n=1 Tax=Coccomyxa viridis TaxID=1274662 RepID=A0AAV1IMS5_9CHLO|nr:hypothetical protein CVIRNUC_010497 [Coccomyxa viridis]